MKIIEKLVYNKEKTLEYFNLSDADLGLTYQKDKWDIRRVLCHLADAETILYDRIRRVISEPRPVIWAFDQDAWADGLNYSTFPLSISQKIFDATRDGVTFLAKDHYESKGDLEFIHSETGLRTLQDEFDKIYLHNEHHLQQIERALMQSKNS